MDLNLKKSHFYFPNGIKNNNMIFINKFMFLFKRAVHVSTAHILKMKIIKTFVPICR